MAAFLTPYQFRFCPARYIHPAHLIYPWAGVMTSIPDWRHQARNNGLLLNQLALHTDYLQPGGLGGIALFDPDNFNRLTIWLGAILHGRSIRTSLSAHVLQHVHQAIGIQGHRFCLTQLDLLIGEWPNEWQHPLPDMELTDYFSHCGLRFWCAALVGADPTFIQRLWLRLPPDIGGITKSNVQPHSMLAKVLCQKIAKKVSAECYHLLK